MACKWTKLEAVRTGSNPFTLKIFSFRFHINSRRRKQGDLSALLLHWMTTSSDNLSVQTICPSSSMKTAKALTQRNYVHLLNNYVFPDIKLSLHLMRCPFLYFWEFFGWLALRLSSSVKFLSCWSPLNELKSTEILPLNWLSNFCLTSASSLFLFFFFRKIIITTFVSPHYIIYLCSTSLLTYTHGCINELWIICDTSAMYDQH